jgi:hypothetical protein
METKFCMAMLALLCLFSGCKSPPPEPRAQAGLTETTRNNCYSLLHQLLDDEKDVSMLRFIKGEDTDLKALIKRVSAAAKAGSSQLEAFAKQDPTLALDHYDLPPGEVKTRASISKMEEKDLLHDSGNPFELVLIVTQVEALNYASHLAKVAGENDSQPERALFLKGLSEEMKNLHDEVLAHIAVRPILSVSTK